MTKRIAASSHRTKQTILMCLFKKKQLQNTLIGISLQGGPAVLHGRLVTDMFDTCSHLGLICGCIGAGCLYWKHAVRCYIEVDGTGMPSELPLGSHWRQMPQILRLSPTTPSFSRLEPPLVTTVQENVCNSSKKRKSSRFPEICKKGKNEFLNTAGNNLQ